MRNLSNIGHEIACAAKNKQTIPRIKSNNKNIVMTLIEMDLGNRKFINSNIKFIAKLISYLEQRMNFSEQFPSHHYSILKEKKEAFKNSLRELKNIYEAKLANNLQPDLEDIHKTGLIIEEIAEINNRSRWYEGLLAPVFMSLNLVEISVTTLLLFTIATLAF